MGDAWAGGRWVDSWVSAPQPTGQVDLPPTPFTLRQTVRVTVGGPRTRLRLSHAYGGTALSISAVSVALPRDGRAGVSAIQPGTARPVSFHGRTSVVVPDGAVVESDPVDFDVPAGANLAVTMCLACRDVTSHPGSRTTSYLLVGNHVTDAELPGATPVDGWYVLNGVRVLAATTTAVAVLIGDSLTDGRGSTTNLNDRWPDRLFDRLRSNPDANDVAILNLALGGSRLLDDVDGQVRGALGRDALRWLVVFKGVNDIGTAAATRPAQRQVAAELIEAYDRIVTRAHRCGARAYGATLPPFGGHADYDDPRGFRDATRRAVNEWVRTSGRFDGVLDFDAAVRDPGQPRRLSPGFDEGDHLHLNPAGYRALADAVPVRLFRDDASGEGVGGGSLRDLLS
jgi:lysophospholipase L1-like esterase